PRSVIFGIGTLFTPAPARPTALSDAGISRLCMSAERTRMASGSAMSPAMRYRSAGSRDRPILAIGLSVRTVYTDTILSGHVQVCDTDCPRDTVSCFKLIHVSPYMHRFPLRRAGVLSLLVALFALGGASVAPTRGFAGTHATAIVWEARSVRQAPIVRNARRRRPVAIAGAVP